MKRFLFIALLIAFTQNLYSQKTGSIAPGLGLTANYGSGAMGIGLEGWISEKNVIIPSVAFQYYDIDNRMVIDYGFGIAFRHHFSRDKLKPFFTLGGNLATRTFDEDTGKEDINFWGVFTGFGAQYFLSDKFSVGFQVGIDYTYRPAANPESINIGNQIITTMQDPEQTTIGIMRSIFATFYF